MQPKYTPNEIYIPYKARVNLDNPSTYFYMLIKKGGFPFPTTIRRMTEEGGSEVAVMKIPLLLFMVSHPPVGYQHSVQEEQ